MDKHSCQQQRSNMHKSQINEERRTGRTGHGMHIQIRQQLQSREILRPKTSQVLRR